MNEDTGFERETPALGTPAGRLNATAMVVRELGAEIKEAQLAQALAEQMAELGMAAEPESSTRTTIMANKIRLAMKLCGWKVPVDAFAYATGHKPTALKAQSGKSMTGASPSWRAFLVAIIAQGSPVDREWLRDQFLDGKIDLSGEI